VPGFGTFSDAWQMAVVEVGPAGDDAGKGGKYLIIPPDFKGDVPAGYFPVRQATYNGYAAFRAIPVTQSAEDIAKALALVKKLRLYPLSKADAPPEQKHIDTAGKPFDGIAAMDDTFFDSLAKMINEEPVQERDMVAMGQLLSLGHREGQGVQARRGDARRPEGGHPRGSRGLHGSDHAAGALLARREVGNTLLLR
jgi:hypothetical protein